MITTTYIDTLVFNERRAIHWYFGWFVLIVAVGVFLISVNLAMGWMKEIGPAIGSAFVLLLAKPPLTEVLKRRDRITALNTLRISLSQANLEGNEAARVDTIVWGMLQKMAEG